MADKKVKSARGIAFPSTVNNAEHPTFDSESKAKSWAAELIKANPKRKYEVVKDQNRYRVDVTERE
jgi:hypothetical protein